MHLVTFAKSKVADVETAYTEVHHRPKPRDQLRSDTGVMHFSYERLPIHCLSNCMYKLDHSIHISWAP